MTTLAMSYQFLDTRADVEPLLDDPAWVMEQKMDGTRGIAVLTKDSFVMLGGSEPLKHTAATQHLAKIQAGLADVMNSDLGMFHPTVILDGEIIIGTGEYRLFDILIEGVPFHERRQILEYVPVDYPVSVVGQAVTSEEKRALLDRCEAQGVEGVVLKHRDGLWQPGKRVPTVLKYKFVKTADVVVMSSSRSRNEAGREVGSFEFAVWNDDCYQVLGRCSAIGKPDARPGDVIEVAYLYRESTGGLVQPRMLRIREDKPFQDCTLSQFREYSREVV